VAPPAVWLRTAFGFVPCPSSSSRARTIFTTRSLQYPSRLHSQCIALRLRSWRARALRTRLHWAMTGYNAISFVILEICVQAGKSKVGQYSVQQVEEGYERFVVMFMLRLLLLTLGYSQLQILHNVRDKTLCTTNEFPCSATRTRFVVSRPSQPMFMLTQVLSGLSSTLACRHGQR